MPDEFIKLITPPNFKAMVLRFKYEEPEIANTTLRACIMSLQKAAVTEARNQLRSLVYAAPLPQSVYTTWWTPEKYMQLRRLGKVWQAVKSDPPVGTAPEIYGDTKVDRSDFEKFYYAYILNKGAMTIRYAPRPYWTITAARMRVALKAAGLESLKGWKLQLLGSSLGASRIGSGIIGGDTNYASGGTSGEGSLGGA